MSHIYAIQEKCLTSTSVIDILDKVTYLLALDAYKSHESAGPFQEFNAYCSFSLLGMWRIL